MATVEIHGHQGWQGDTVFAFCVLRFAHSIDRDGVRRVLHYIAPLVPDPDELMEQLPGELEESIVLLGLPWQPPEPGHGVDAQRRLIESAATVGIVTAWFFQTGTTLATGDEPEQHDSADDEIKTGPAPSLAPRGAVTPSDLTTDDAWRDDDMGGLTTTQAVDIDPTNSLDETLDAAFAQAFGPQARSGSISDAATVDASVDPDGDDDELDDELATATRDAVRPATSDDPDGEWTHGQPPQVQTVRFPVDGYPQIVDELDWEDFGIAFKLAGTAEAGEGTMLLGFHTLWLAPYGGRYRNASVTFDRERHAVHLWVDRFAVPCAPELQARHLLWIVSKIDEVIPVVHARFAGATMAQKYGGLMGEAGEPFVLGGNPLLAVYAGGGTAAVDAWVEWQSAWTPREVAQMLREIAIEIVTSAPRIAPVVLASGEQVDAVFDDDEPAEAEDEEVDEVGEDDADEGDGDDDDDDGDDDDDDDDGDGDDDDDGEAEGNEDEDRGRQITSLAGELLRARAAAGKLDARTAAQLMPVLDQTERYEHRRRAVVEILGAMRHKPAVPAMIRILEDNPIASALDAIGKEDLLASTAAALGAIADPAAIPALAKLVAAPGRHHDKPRPVAAHALATCLAAVPEPRDIDDASLAALLRTIKDRNDSEINAETHLAYGRLARQLRAERRAEASRKLVDTETARDDRTALLARHAALVLASAPLGTPSAEVRALLHECLSALDYDHDATVRGLRIALRVADMLPELVDPVDLHWLTRFSEPDLRADAHALLGKLGHAMTEAAAYDRAAARALDDTALVHAIAEPHVVGRAAVIAEAHRRHLAAARRATVAACEDVRARARHGSANLLEPDSRVLEAGVALLRDPPLDGEAVALFDRLLRHSNPHVKWELLQAPPSDERLIAGMFHVVGERWGWQEAAAKEWLAQYQGTPAYEHARKSAPTLDEEDDDRDIN